MKKFSKLSNKELTNIIGGGRIAYYLGYMAGAFYNAFDRAGEWIDRSGFNHQGANK